MYHEATACHVSGDLLELMTALLELLRCLQTSRDLRVDPLATGRNPQDLELQNPAQLILGCKEWMDVLRKLATLLNSYNSDEMRKLSLGGYMYQIAVCVRPLNSSYLANLGFPSLRSIGSNGHNYSK